jgi:hypothetical protein
MNFTRGFIAVSKKHNSEAARHEIEVPIGKRQTLSVRLTGRKVLQATLPGPLFRNQQKLGTEIQGGDMAFAFDARCQADSGFAGTACEV